MITDKKPTIQQMREIMRRMNYAYKTESSYCDWVKRFIKFSQMQSRDELFDKNKWGQINGEINGDRLRFPRLTGHHFNKLYPCSF